MQDSSVIDDIWSTGQFFGQNKAQTRVTVEKDYYLNRSTPSVGTSKKGPFRWFQDRTHDLSLETEIPNVKSVQINADLGTDAAKCTIEIYNQWMVLNGEENVLPEQLGKPGYLGPYYGASDEAKGRWNQALNDWQNVLVPNALLRTYQGYGNYDVNGKPLTISAGLTSQNLLQTGTWLIDKVQITSAGSIHIEARDMAKLLIDQQIFPPLIPQDEYPLTYYRWKISQENTAFHKRKPITTGGVKEIHPKYDTSSGDAWFGYNANIEGHRPTEALDGRDDTFWLSVGNSYPTRPFCTDFIQVDVNGGINEVYVKPWLGNYQMFISIMENGKWVDSNHGLIEYDPSILFATQTPAVDTHANIPYVMQTGVPWETGKWYKLPRVFNAQKLRITFRNHQLTPWGPWFYRCGIRDLKIRVNTSATSPAPLPWCYSAAPDRSTDPGADGYWVLVDDGQVFAFGDARTHTISSHFPIEGDSKCLKMYGTSTGGGYWIMQHSGRVIAYGDAGWFGDCVNHQDYTPSSVSVHNAIGFAPTHTGLGYYVITRDGHVYPFGDAVWYGNMVNGDQIGLDYNADYVATDIETHPTVDGYWILNGDGRCRAFGAVSVIGEITDRSGNLLPHEWCTDLTRNKAGTGYWILAGTAKVFGFGSVTTYGEGYGVNPLPADATDESLLEHYRDLTWCFTPNGAENGYYILEASGVTLLFGTVNDYGRPGTTGQLRSNGNMLDYSDIVKDLCLWSGFWLHDSSPVGPPSVYGNIETTGAYPPDEMTADQFDKKSPMEIITMLKQIVAYIFHIDQQGAIQFSPANFWSSGNFLLDGTPYNYIPELDEQVNMSTYAVNLADETARSQIIISTDEPDNITGAFSTNTTILIPDTSDTLKGMVKPAMWTNGSFIDPTIQKIMAELIALQLWFQQRSGAVTIAGNPNLGLDDQVRILERTTGEAYIHYISGYSSTHDLDTGSYSMNLTTHWLGDDTQWVITKSNIDQGTFIAPGTIYGGSGGFQLSRRTVDWIMDNNTSHKTSQVRINEFDPPNARAVTLREVGTDTGANGASTGI